MPLAHDTGALLPKDKMLKRSNICYIFEKQDIKCDVFTGQLFDSQPGQINGHNILAELLVPSR